MSGRVWIEALGFGALALGLHAAAFWAMPQGATGAAGAGAGGEDMLTLEAAPASYVEMVARFDAPPVPRAPLALPAEPPRIALPRVALPDLVMLPPEPPRVETAPPPEAEREPAPQPEAEPEARPDPEPKPEPKPEPVPVAKPATRADAKPAPRPDTPRPATPRPDTSRPDTPRASDAPPQGQAAARASDGQAGSRAAGTGGGTVAGDAGTASAATLAPGRAQDLRAQWGATIRARIERRKTYPAAAGRAAGAVTVRLSVTRAGALAGVSVANSSGHAALDQAAVQAVQRAGKFPPAPKGLSEASYSFTLTMKFAR